MIQELLGMVEERKISIPGGLLVTDHGSSSSSSSSFSSPSSATSSPSPMSSSSTSSEPQQNLRCPRCDSPNTKFCYYNNYNLTQPRHFCKTCRRYWTKGGALRNVPIGGGCRKAKPSPTVTAASRAVGAKIKSPSPVGLDQDLASSPILWASPYSPQLLALLRANQLQNPNPNPTPTKVVAEPAGEQSLNLDPLRQLAVGQSNSLWMGGGGQYQYPYHQHQQQLQQQHQQQHNVLMGEMQSSGIQELLQRLRSSANYHNNHSPAAMSNVGSGVSFSSSSNTTANVATSTGASILEPLPLSSGDFGYWNPAFSWADLPTTNGAFP